MDAFYIDDIVNITSQGILCKCETGEVYIRFSECIKNFSKEFPSGSGRCVATSDILNGYYTFYTEPKTIIRIRRKRYVHSIFKRQKKARDFIELQKKIYNQGFTTFDLT